MSRAFASLLVVLVAACSGESKPAESKPGEGQAPAVQPGLELVIPRSPPKVGEQELKVTEVAMTMRFDANGTKVTARSTKRVEELLKVLAVDGYAVTEAEVTYKSVSETEEVGGHAERTSDPRAGKTYRVTRENGVPVARAVTGTATPEELEEVVDDNDGIGVEDEIDAILSSKTWRSGEPVIFSADELARVNASKVPRPGADKETVTSLQFTLLSRRDGVASFALTMGMRLDGEGGVLEFTIEGTALVEIEKNRMRELGGAGAVTGTIQGMSVEGEISMKIESRWVSSS